MVGRPTITETTPSAPSGPFVWGDRDALGVSEVEQDCRYEENRGPEALAFAMRWGLSLGLAGLAIWWLGHGR